ncbi:MAG: alpha/beta fold hydrolase [Trueperaceae bacterium]|nr:alpha/beta fold hydrolase [Trueperaceae bacterium]
MTFGRVARGVGLAVVATIVLALVAGFVYQRIASARDAARHTPPGTRLQVDGRAVHVLCRGSGSPPVVVVPGSGSGTIDWQPAQRVLAQDRRVCSYDRPGYGWSDPRRDAGRPDAVVRDLDRVVRHALGGSAGDGPTAGTVVLLGHGFGGSYARLYAQRRPDRVAGLLLVDARHEEARERLPGGIVALEDRTESAWRGVRVLAHLGLVRLFAPLLHEAPDLPADALDAYWAQLARPAFFAATAAERGRLEEVERTLREADAYAMAALPTVVLRHGRDDMFGSHPDAEAAERTWRRLQEDLARRAGGAPLLVAEDAGHDVHLERPGALRRALASLDALLAR